MLFFGAKVISNEWLQIPEAEMTMVALSPAIFFVAISSVMRGYFNGKQNLKATARSQTLEQVFKTALTVILVEIIAIVSNISTEWMAGGATLATTLATMAGFGYLYLFYKVQSKELAKEIKQSTNYKYERVRTIIKNILIVSIPIALTAIMSSLNKNIDSFTVVRSLKQFLPEDLALKQYGILGGKVDTLTSLPLSINVAFSTALVPAISAAKAIKDKKTITRKTSFSLLTSMLIGLPCTVGMFIFAGPILQLLFPRASAGEVILQISSLTIIFTILDQTINGALQGYGKLRIPAISLGIGVIVKLIMNLILVPIPKIGVKWSSMGFSCMSCSCIYNFNNCTYEKYKTRFIIFKICNKASNCIINYGNMFIFYLYDSFKYSKYEISYINCNNICCNSLFTCNSCFENI